MDPSVIIHKGNYTGNISDEEMAYQFPYQPDHFQMWSFEAINLGHHVLVTAHTGSGKTAVAKYAIASTIRSGKKVMYTSPIKALSNQKYKELIEDFELEFSDIIGRQIEVGIMTGDEKVKPDADIVVLTTEILRNSLYTSGNHKNYFGEDFTDRLGCVIFDEVHYITDPNRGRVWEETINLLPPSVQMIMLSATIDKPELFAHNIAKKTNGIPIHLIPTSHRVIPLETYLYVNNGLKLIAGSDEQFIDNNYDEAKSTYKNNKKYTASHKINELMTYLKTKNLFQTIFFCFSKAKCERYANNVTRNLIEYKERDEIIKIFEKYLGATKRSLQNDGAFINQYNDIYELCKKGIAFHHSGVVQPLREVIEIIFAKGLVRVLFATETFAVGVNMPTRTVVFTQINKYDDNGERYLSTPEYKQMAGRAGRRGIDKFGKIIILPLHNFPEKQALKSMMTGSLPSVKSTFDIGYSFLLKMSQSSCKSMDDFLNHSMLWSDLMVTLNDLRIEESQLQQLVDAQELKVDTNTLSNYIKLLNKHQEQLDLGSTRGYSKEIEKMKKVLQNEGHSLKLSEYHNFRNNKYELSSLQKKINNTSEMIDINGENVKLFLNRINYIKLPDMNTTWRNVINEHVSPSGVFASRIDDCNPITLTQMFTNNIFDDLEPVEMVSLLGLFIDDIRGDNAKSYKNIQCSDKIYDKVLDILDIIDNMVDIEKECNLSYDLYGYWDVYYDYIDMIYWWASGWSLIDIHHNLNEYGYTQVQIGNFCRAIQKTANLIDNIINHCEIIGKEYLIPKWDIAKELIMRDILLVGSLYVAS